MVGSRVEVRWGRIGLGRRRKNKDDIPKEVCVYLMHAKKSTGFDKL